MKMKAIF